MARDLYTRIFFSATRHNVDREKINATRFYTAIHLLLDDKERIFQRHSSLAPSLNLKSDPRPVSPRRPRGTLGGSAIAPQPLAHRWKKIPCAPEVRGTVRSYAGTCCAPAVSDYAAARADNKALRRASSATRSQHHSRLLAMP